jgi:hypothetical protein
LESGVATSPDSEVLGSLSAPDGIEPLVGWRYWRVESCALTSLTRSVYWPALERYEADCRLSTRHGAPPAAECHCGVYAAKNLDTLKDLATPNMRLPLVVGKVALWGRVIPAERGYRAQYGYPKRLWLVWESLEPLEQPGARRIELAAAYGVTVEFCDAEWALSSHPLHRPPPMPGTPSDVPPTRRRLTNLVRDLVAGRAFRSADRDVPAHRR